jgi:hypothetical protein
MGMNNTMTLRVWFTHGPTEQPMVFRIGGEFLAGKGAKKDKDGKEVDANVLPIVSTEAHLIPVGRTANEIIRVEQVFDVRTVPIKRIDALVLGKNDSRTGDAKQLLSPLPPFAQEAVAPPAEAGAGGGPPAGPMGSGPGPMGPGPGPMGPGPGPMGGGQQSVRGQDRAGGPIAAVSDGNQRRYFDRNEQVRRMPVGIVVVVDQSYMQDVLLAFANSPLRFQITQVSWTRFRANDLATGTNGSTSGTSGVVEGKGDNYVGGSGDPDSMGSSGKPRLVGPGPVGPGPVGPGPVGPVGPGPMGYPVGPNSSGGFSIASESQITSGLVELSIYGVVSLYEKFTDAPATVPAPGPEGPAPAPGPVPPGPPINPTTPPGKMRRRVRT